MPQFLILMNVSLQQDSGFSRVLIFTVLGVGHFNRNHIIAIHIMITNTLVRVPNLYFGTIQLWNLTTTAPTMTMAMTMTMSHGP